MFLKPLTGCFLLCASSVILAQTETIQHEINFGLSDLQDDNDQFIGLQYKYYIDEVEIDQQPYLISPYLQRISNVSIDYFGADNLHLVGLRGEYFINKDYVIRGLFRHQKDDLIDGSAKDQQLGFDVGRFINPNWQVGAGLDYFKSVAEFSVSNDQFPLFNGQRFEVKDSDLGARVFARYTSFDTNASKFAPGWDVELNASIIGDVDSVFLKTRYFFSPQWSASLDLLNRTEFRSGTRTTAELGTDYWFNKNLSLKFGLGADLEDSGLASATLLLTGRF